MNSFMNKINELKKVLRFNHKSLFMQFVLINKLFIEIIFEYFCFLMCVKLIYNTGIPDNMRVMQLIRTFLLTLFG
jgi:hypothetical protein